MSYQISQHLPLTKVTGMQLGTIFPFPWDSTILVMPLLKTQQFPTNCDIVTAMSGHAVTDDSTNEAKTGVCDLEK